MNESAKQTSPYSGKNPKPSALRWWCDWVETQDAMYDFNADSETWPSSMYDAGAPDGEYPSAAQTLMDLVTLGEGERIAEAADDPDDDYEPYCIALVRDQRATTLFVFSDDSSIEFDLQDKWWRVGGQVAMYERYDYAYNNKTGKIEQVPRRSSKRSIDG